MMFPSRNIVERLRKEYPAGCRIVLDEMDDPYTKIPIGSQATCQGVDDAGNIMAAWDTGSFMQSIKIMLRSSCESLLFQDSQQKSLSIIVYSPLRNAFRSGSSFQSGISGVFIFLSIVSRALRRASGFAFAYTCVVSMDSCPRKSRM